MAMPRSMVVANGEIAAYHCIARCVRRAFLCGNDPLSGRDLSHRKSWIRQKLMDIARSFALEIGSYAVMSNHLHVVVKTRPDIAADWDADEITTRWRIAFPVHRPAAVLRTLYQAEVADKKLVARRRQRLSNISWFMRCLLERVARRANKEDQCKGRFWEERFECIGLLDDSAILACSAYVDLNPIRAGIAKTPEESKFTSIFERIRQRQEQPTASQSRDHWLAPITNKPSKGRANKRVSHQSWLDMSLDEYLQLVDWTGRSIRADKKGAIPAEIAPILDRLRIRGDAWMMVARHFGAWFKRWAGTVEHLEARARQQKLQRIHGRDACKDAFE